jgi:hypothetical protein
MYLSYTHALILKAIAAGKAELFANSEPDCLYISGCQTGDDATPADALRQFKQFGLVDENCVKGCIMEYHINMAGLEELGRHFPGSRMRNYTIAVNQEP